MRTMKSFLALFLAALFVVCAVTPALATDTSVGWVEFYWDKAGEDADNGYTAYEIAYGSVLKTPEEPKREGYTFLGWKDWDTEQIVDLSTQVMNVPLRRFYAAWQVVTYTSRFYVFGELWTSVENVPGEPFVHPRLPSVDGYTFTGWDPKLPEIAPAAELEFNAVFVQNTYTSRFYVFGELWASVENVPGEPFVQPRLPSVAGYTFAGWDPKTPETAPAAELEFNAVMIPNTYFATLMVDGIVYSIIPYTYGQKSIDLPDVPEKPGYSGSWEPYSLVIGGVTIHAIYKQEIYIATLLVDGEVYMEIPYTYGQKSIDLPAVPKKVGYTGEWESYSLVIGGVTINAIYTIETYIATLLVDGEVYMEIPYTYGQKSIDLPAVPKKAGYTGEWEPYSLVAGGVTIRAIYTPNTYIATLLVDGEIYKEIPYTYGQKSVPLPEVPKKEGCTGMWGPYSLVVGGTTIEAIYSPLDNTAKTVNGDADGDGSIGLKDVVLLTRTLAGGWNVRVCAANMDVNNDGSIDLKDVTLIRRYLAGGWDVTL